MNKGQAFVAAVYETFSAEPEKIKEFDKITTDAHKIFDVAGYITRMAQLIQGHRNLLLRLRDVFPEADITIPSEADITIPPEADEFTMSAAMTFLNNVKIRFQIVDDHVYPSVLRELKMYREHKKSLKKMKEKVLDLLYYHEDLTEEFLRFFP